MQRFNGVVVITLASHARGPGFDPQLNLRYHFFFYHLCYFFHSLRHEKYLGIQPITGTVVVAEWLRRWTRNPLGSPRAGSSPADYGGMFVLKVDGKFHDYLAVTDGGRCRVACFRSVENSMIIWHLQMAGVVDQLASVQ